MNTASFLDLESTKVNLIVFSDFVEDLMGNISKYINKINYFWQARNELVKGTEDYCNVKKLLQVILDDLDKGLIRVCEPSAQGWKTNEWVKKSILLYFQLFKNYVISSSITQLYDKLPIKFDSWEEEDFIKANIRVVPGAIVRKGAYIAKNSIIMPSFINIGAYVGESTMIDTWSTIGSCAQIGKNCHISGGVGIGGILEPLQATPVIIEDNCFIGARSEITEGVKIERGAVISMGVYLSASTKIVYRDTGEIIYGYVPSNAVVVPGALPNKNPNLPSLNCAVIVKQVDQQTREKTSINDLLRT